MSSVYNTVPKCVLLVLHRPVYQHKRNMELSSNAVLLLTAKAMHCKNGIKTQRCGT